MTTEEFVEAFRHEIDGWILDAAMEGRTGAELSVWLRNMRKKVEIKLTLMHQAAVEDKPLKGMK